MAAALLFLCIGAAHAQTGLKQIKMLSREGDPDVVKIADLQKVAPDFDGKTFILTINGASTEAEDAKSNAPAHAIPFQVDDLDGDGKPDEIAYTVEPNTRTRRVVTLTYGPENLIAPLRGAAFPKRAHALYAQKYEGMGWESDRVAWRIYWDKRNAIDLYGKKKHGLALDYFAKPGVNYHAESPIGRDIFKNGETLGLGSIGAVVDNKVVRISDVTERKWRVIADGPVRAIAELTYTGWKVGGKSVDLTSRLTIWAGQHYFEHRVTSPNADGIQLVTGLPIKPNVVVMTTSANKGKAYLATWGKQVLKTGATATEALPDQNLGLAIVLALDPKDGDTHAGPKNEGDTLLTVTLDKNHSARYFVAAAWDQEQKDENPLFRVLPDPALTLPSAVNSAQAWEHFVDNIPTVDPIVHIVSKKSAPAPVGFAPVKDGPPAPQ